MARLFLIDGSGYLYRAFYAVRNLSRRDGFPTNAIFGFTRMVRKVISDHAPEYLCLVFDAKGPTFRHERDETYKSQRKPMPEELAIQVPVIHQVVEAHRIPMITWSGAEADDVIGTLTAWGREQGLETVIVSSDKDLMQLIQPGVRMLDPQRGGWIDEAEATAFWGVPPALAPDVIGLAGDSSDNIPGVPGIGMKTAAELIRQFGSLEAVLAGAATIRQVKRRELLTQYADQARHCRFMGTIRCDLAISPDLAACHYQEPDIDRLREIFQDMEFTSLVRELDPPAPPKPAVLELGLEDIPERDYRAITDEASFQELLADLARQPGFSLDIETTGLDPLQAELVGISFSWAAGQACYVPVGHTGEAAPHQLPRQLVIDGLKPILADGSKAKTGQNLKYELTTLRKYGVFLNGIQRDAMILSYLLYGPTRRHNLDAMALDELGRTTITYEQVTGTGRHALRFDQVPLARAMPYACEDAEVAWQVSDKLAARLAAIPELMQLYQQVELPLLPILGEMELAGALIDQPGLARLSATLGKRREELTREIHQLAGESFNVNSTQQLGVILFEKLGIKGGKRTKTGFSTDMSVLTKLAEEGHLLPEKILAYRSLTKLQNTYTDALQERLDGEGRIHTSFNQAVTLTGRLSSSDPNLQNIPTRTEEGRAIRAAFVAPPGWVLMSADYSQIELRLLAHLGDVERLRQAFHQGGDIHQATAAEIFGLAPAAVTAEARRMAKTINFGLIYGMSAFGLARRLDMPVGQARAFMDRYFERYQGVRAFMERGMQEVRLRGWARTLLGRRCPLPDIVSANRALRENAERAAINAPLQGSAADLIKLAMIRLHQALAGTRSRMILQVHDELVLEVPIEEVTHVTQLVRTAMEGAAQLSVPLVADVGTGRHWAEAH